MRNMIRGFLKFSIYLLPVFLLATAGALLMGLVYYPTPTTYADRDSQTASVADENYWRAHAEDMIAILLDDALRHFREEQDGRAVILRFQYEHDQPSEEQPAMLRLAPPPIENGGAADRPALIRL
jgi:hypothetical protein